MKPISIGIAMTRKKVPPGTEAKAGTGRGRAADPTTEDGFDRWLERQLHRLYDDVLAEELPKELAELLNRFESRSDGSGRRLDDD